ncbi:MAG TPA: L-glutamate gamma-semialdehyde dehydrogenase [Bacteroidales bacterium]|nr:L-glutamate gamma-semialdehyde dehydrogenase [Bacteroidales bacterium]
MNNALFFYNRPLNEPAASYTINTAERIALEKELERQSSTVADIPLIIDGKEIRTGNTAKVVMPHNHGHILAEYHLAGEKEVNMAIEAALNAHKRWSVMSWVERVSITLKMAELVTKKHRYLINASTMLGQGKNAYQAEIDAVCETVDFIRFNAYYVSEIYNDQPHSETGTLNRLEYRPLEGFVFAISPFNFTAIASNLVLSPVVVGNTVVWKPATTSLLSNYYLMKLFQEAGLPNGVINFVPGNGSTVGNVALNHKFLGGVHFTGGNPTFNHIWKTVANNIENYRSYPRIVGETGGKDFVMVHPTADADEVATALVRGAFEYQGQKCSAASRAYIPESLWKSVNQHIGKQLKQIKQGNPADFCNFVNAVIDEKAYNRIMQYIKQAKDSSQAEIIHGGNGDNSVGYFIEPTVILAKDPYFVTMQEEIFGPVLTIYVYPDEEFQKTLAICDNTSPYGLTGSIFSKDRYALIEACSSLRYAAGNLYFNDKPTGAVVGQQPFGGSRQSGTNDKAGSHLNLLRWINPRTIKETFLPPTDFRYPYMFEKGSRCG